MKTNKKGFTLIELMVVMAIIAVLAVLIIGAITLARHASTETTNRSNARTISVALEGAFADNKAYCGYTGGPVCGTTYSFTAIAALIGSPALASTTTAAHCGTTDAVASGGGQVTGLGASTYTITPWNYGCAAALGASDQLSVQ